MSWDIAPAPWLEVEGFADIILDKVSWEDILEECEVSHRENGAGSYKVQCPFHSSGAERTPSLSASEDNNTYYCFACASSGSKIDFVSKIFGMPFHRSMEWMSTLAGISDSDFDLSGISVKKHRIPEETVAHYVHKSGILLRDTLKSFYKSNEYSKWQIWVDKQFVKLDMCLDLGDDSWEKSKQYLQWLENIITKRIGK